MYPSGFRCTYVYCIRPHDRQTHDCVRFTISCSGRTPLGMRNGWSSCAGSLLRGWCHCAVLVYSAEQHCSKQSAVVHAATHEFCLCQSQLNWLWRQSQWDQPACAGNNICCVACRAVAASRPLLRTHFPWLSVCRSLSQPGEQQIEVRCVGGVRVLLP